jgi:pimeloyl-ACP methyl ester carboxylesterase
MNGDDDPIMPLINEKILAFMLPSARLHIVEGGGHLFLSQRARETAHVIEKFLPQVCRRPRLQVVGS